MVVTLATVDGIWRVVMRVCAVLMAAALLAACDPYEGTGGGVGFESYGGIPADSVTSAPGLQPELVISGEGSLTANPEDLARASQGVDGAVEADAGAAVAAETAAVITELPPASNPAISDEQDFEAVSNRQSIESDRERLEQQKAQYQIIEPTALPRRPNSGANIVAFALATSHGVGEQVYRRLPAASANRAATRCARFTSDDQAQEAFLEAGGPERDRMGVDPDGDGYACGWNPAPFRRAG
ncbi:MAG: hypothetical protein AAF667_10720 [Pseudomonadota bacterium]